MKSFKRTTTVVLFSNIVHNISSVVFSCRHFSKLSLTASNDRGSWEAEFCMQFHFHANHDQNHFHKNGFALRLALKQRHKRTLK